MCGHQAQGPAALSTTSDGALPTRSPPHASRQVTAGQPEASPRSISACTSYKVPCRLLVRKPGPITHGQPQCLTSATSASHAMCGCDCTRNLDGCHCSIISLDGHTKCPPFMQAARHIIANERPTQLPARLRLMTSCSTAPQPLTMSLTSGWPREPTLTATTAGRRRAPHRGV